LSLPLGTLLLALAAVTKRVWLQLAAAALLAGMGMLHDSRSNSAFLLLACVVVLWQFTGRVRKRPRIFLNLLLLAAAAAAVFAMLQAAILDGYFGEVTRARTQEQIDTSGSLILGGRPELAASVALVTRHPFGLGSGVVPSAEDVAAAKASMFSTGYDPNNNYVDSYLFGQGVEVHSNLGDLWLWFGLPGVLFAGVMGAIVIRGLSWRLQLRAVDVLFAYLAIRFAWNLLFSPLPSSAPQIPLVLALALATADMTRPLWLRRASGEAGPALVR
jgi:hypothetical protein